MSLLYPQVISKRAPIPEGWMRYQKASVFQLLCQLGAGSDGCTALTLLPSQWWEREARRKRKPFLLDSIFC